MAYYHVLRIVLDIFSYVRWFPPDGEKLTSLLLKDLKILECIMNKTKNVIMVN